LYDGRTDVETFLTFYDACCRRTPTLRYLPTLLVVTLRALYYGRNVYSGIVSLHPSPYTTRPTHPHHIRAVAPLLPDWGVGLTPPPPSLLLWTDGALVTCTPLPCRLRPHLLPTDAVVCPVAMELHSMVLVANLLHYPDQLILWIVWLHSPAGWLVATLPAPPPPPPQYL